MSAVSPLAETSAVPSPVNLAGDQRMAEFWRAGLEYIARGVIAYQSAAQQARLAEAYSSRQTTSPAVAAAAHQAREQIRPHKETFNDCIRALSDLAPGGLPVAPSSDDSAVLNARVTTLEAQMNHLAETIKPLERKLAPLDDTLARIESGRKTTEDNLSSTIAQLEKSHEQLNGRVTSLSEQVATSAVPEFRVAIEAENSALKSRLSAVETVIKRRAEGVKDIQEGFNGQSSRLESLESGLRDMKSQTQEIRGQVQPLVPLTREVDTLLSMHTRVKSVSNGLTELRERSESERVRVDSLNNTCESLSQNLKASDDTVTSLAPLKTHVQSLKQLAAKSISLLSIVSQRAQLAKDIKQLQDDVARHSRDISQVQSTAVTLEQQVQGLGAISTGVKGLIERFESAKETIDGIRVLGEQVAELASSDHRTKQGVTDGERRIAHLESGANDLQAHVTDLLSIKDRIIALETNSAAAESAKANTNGFAPLENHVPELIALATQAASLSSLIPMHKTAVKDLAQLRGEVKRSTEEGRLQLAELNKKVLGLGAAHLDVQTLVGELQSIKETTDGLRPLSQKFETLSSETQEALADVTRTVERALGLEEDILCTQAEIQDVSEQVKGTSAKLAAGQTTIEWMHKAVQTMQSQMTSLEPLKQRAEGLMLLVGHTESLMPLPAQFAVVSDEVKALRADYASLARKTTRVKKKLDTYEVNQAEATSSKTQSHDQSQEDLGDFEETQRRLDALEQDMKAVQSKASKKTSARLDELEHALGVTDLRAKRASEMVQLNNNDLAALLPLTNNVEALLSLADQKATLTSFAQVSQQVKLEYLPTWKERVQTLDQLVLRVSSIESQGSKFEDQLAAFAVQCATLSAEGKNVSALQERVMELETGAKILKTEQQSRDEARKEREEETKDLKVKVDGAMVLIDSTVRKISELSLLLPFVAELMSLSTKADELMAFVDQASQITEKLSQMSKAQNGISGRFDKLKDSVATLDKSATTFDLKSSSLETIVKAIEQELRDEKEDKDWCKRELRRLASELNELAPLKKHSTTLLAITSPLESPVSPAQHDPLAHEVRIQSLEKLAASANKELMNIASTFPRFEEAYKKLASPLIISKPLLPLVGHVPGLIALLTREGDPTPPAEWVNTLPTLLRRVDVLEAQDTNRAAHAGTIEPLKALLPLVDQIEALTSLTGRLDIYEQLVDQVNDLLPLAGHISELQSITEHLPLIEKLAALDNADSNTQSQSSIPSQLRSPPSERYSSHPIGFSTPTSLLPAPDIASSSGRPSRKRKLEAAIDSLEVQLDNMRNEIDDVSWNVRTLSEQRVESKRRRREQDGQEGSGSGQGDNGAALGEQGRSTEVDLTATVREVLVGLWQGEDGWLERLDTELGRLWAKTLNVGEAENARSVIARSVSELREDIDTLRLAIEARGSGVEVSGSAMANASNVVGIEKLAQQLIDNMLVEQSQFKDQLKEWLDDTMKPVTDMFAAMQQVQGRLR